jgi:hypothetical protein
MVTLSPTELAALIVLGGSILAYAIGGGMHIAIDYVHGKRLLRKYWDATDAKLAGIESRVNSRIDLVRPPPVGPELAQLEERLVAKIPPPVSTEDLSSAFESFLRSDAGQQWATELGELAADRVTAGIVAKTTSAAGAAARTAQSSIERMIMGSIDFGNPVLNGVWAAAPYQTKAGFVNRLARIIRKMGLVVLDDGGGEVGQLSELTGTEEAPSVDAATLALYRR